MKLQLKLRAKREKKCTVWSSYITYSLLFHHNNHQPDQKMETIVQQKALTDKQKLRLPIPVCLTSV